MHGAHLRRYKARLLEKMQELSFTKRNSQAGVPGRGTWEGDVIDKANADVEVEVQVRLHQTDVRLLRAIEEALARVRHGTYGVCEVCKQPICKARLAAVPWTRHCRECKECEHQAA